MTIVYLRPGVELLASRPLPKREGHQHAEIVLCKTTNRFHPFVTWQHNSKEGPTATYWGHYFDNYGQAYEDYLTRGN